MLKVIVTSLDVCS